MTTPQQKLREHWAEHFPAVTDDWPYWWIEGDSYCLAIVDGNNLVAAVEIVEDNWERFDLINVHIAKLIDSDLIRREGTHVTISNKLTSKKYIDDLEKADNNYYTQANSNEN